MSRTFLHNHHSVTQGKTGGAKRDSQTFSRIANSVVPLPVRPGKIVVSRQTFEAHGHKRPPEQCGISETLF
jgi:hypothetical protein